MDFIAIPILVLVKDQKQAPDTTRARNVDGMVKVTVVAEMWRFQILE